MSRSNFKKLSEFNLAGFFNDYRNFALTCLDDANFVYHTKNLVVTFRGSDYGKKGDFSCTWYEIIDIVQGTGIICVAVQFRNGRTKYLDHADQWSIGLKMGGLCVRFWD